MNRCAYSVGVVFICTAHMSLTYGLWHMVWALMSVTAKLKIPVVNFCCVLTSPPPKKRISLCLPGWPWAYSSSNLASASLLVATIGMGHIWPKHLTVILSVGKWIVQGPLMTSPTEEQLPLMLPAPMLCWGPQSHQIRKAGHSRVGCVALIKRFPGSCFHCLFLF